MQSQLDDRAPATPLAGLDGGTLARMFRSMLLIRRFEETVNDLYMQGKIPSTLHLYIGQEAVATGVCQALGPDDYVLSTHRPHGHALAKGVAPRALMAELYGKATGACAGKGSSMHVGDMRAGVFPAIAIVGANVPITAGAALAAKMLKNGRIAVSFSGDGAANEGAWHEGLNAAAIWDLPAIFVCENNGYAASTPFKSAFRVQSVAERAAAYGIPGVVVDGNDVLAVYEAARAAAARARQGQGPTLLECMTYRQCGHSRSDPRGYRSREEEAAWLARDPILRFRSQLLADGRSGEAELNEIAAEVEATLQDAVAFAEASPEPALEELFTGVYREPAPANDAQPDGER